MTSLTSFLRSNIAILTTLVCLGFAANTQARVVFHDDFSDGDHDGWYSTASENRAIFVNEDNNLVLPSVVWGSDGGGFLTYFESHTIAVGETIVLSFRVNNGEVNDAGSGYRFGLLNSGGQQITGDLTEANDPTFNAYTGYAAFLNLTNSETKQYIYRRTGTNNALWTTSAAAGSEVTKNFAVSSNEFVDVIFSIERLDEDRALVTTTLGENSITWSGVVVESFFTFDTIGVHLTGQTHRERVYESFSVSVIPEPAHITLFFGLGIFSVLVLRHRTKTKV